MSNWARLLSAIVPMGGRSNAVFQQRLRDLALAHVLSHKFDWLMVVAVAIACSTWVEWQVVAIWFAANTASLYLSARHAATYLEVTDQQKQLRPDALRRWLVSFGLYTFLYLSIWSSALFLFWMPDKFGNNVFLLAIAAVSVSPNLILNRPLPSNFLIAAITLAGFFLGALAWHAFSMLTVVAGSYIAYMIVIAGHCLQLSETTRQSAALSVEKNELITALSKSKKESDAARMRAEEANRAKSQFLANMSHELRTPLNAIIGFSEVMNKQVFGPMTNEKYLQYSDDIHSSGQHLLALINDVLDLSKIEAGQYTIFEEAVDLSIIADDCLRLVNLRAHAVNIEIKKRFVHPLPELKADQRGVRQIWLNLLTNAVKFAPPGSRVTMIIDYLPDGRFYFGVEDEGPGIPEEEFETVLSSFGQGKEGKARPGSGTGLGLAIVRGLLEAHGGHFELESEVGRGTLVRAVFPTGRLLTIPEAGHGIRRTSVAYP
ncbi:MAG: sensor histidine kinase [Alphaproteobacteria bacterium]|nr:two-component sensor histidine kinase [Rhodobiaceae bacterium]MBO6541789.1 sensor histidine kinase [Alphaproteobacteria bacterium]MBO6628725.1 sensor histidine kinase [Alphaproteobacteria bacterium]MDF1625983.1 ATP-binding protein [Parvibaculaceae bacterium]